MQNGLLKNHATQDWNMYKTKLFSLLISLWVTANLETVGIHVFPASLLLPSQLHPDRLKQCASPLHVMEILVVVQLLLLTPLLSYSLPWFVCCTSGFTSCSFCSALTFNPMVAKGSRAEQQKQTAAADICKGWCCCSWFSRLKTCRKPTKSKVTPR